MRIVAGRWAGRLLTSPAGRVRPTSEELRDQWLRYINGWWGDFRLTERLWDVTDLSGL